MKLAPLTYPADTARVARLFGAASDYILLEHGRPPDDTIVADFFTDRPPSVPAHDTHHYGVEVEGHLLGVVSYLFGYPEPQDCYIGLLVLAPAGRGGGLGAQVVDGVKDVARAHGATRLLVAVLEDNPKGRRFWEAQGLRLQQTFPPSHDSHTRHRLAMAL